MNEEETNLSHSSLQTTNCCDRSFSNKKNTLDTKVILEKPIVFGKMMM